MPSNDTKAITTTSHGEAEIGIELGSNIILHCFIPPCGGAGIFAMFDHSIDVAQAISAMKQIIELGPYQPDTNLLEHFNLRGCVAVGTGPSLASRVQGTLSDGHPLKGLLQPASQ